jgi:hypothetical protein
MLPKLLLTLLGLHLALGKTIFQVDIAELKNGNSKLLEDVFTNDGALGNNQAATYIFRYLYVNNIIQQCTM